MQATCATAAMYLTAKLQAKCFFLMKVGDSVYEFKLKRYRCEPFLTR